MLSICPTLPEVHYSNPGVDTSSVVKVYESEQSTSYAIYDYAENILNVDSQSKAFFLDEVEDERYELFFGDGVLGENLRMVIRLNYISSY